MKQILFLTILLSFATTFSQNGSTTCDGAEPSCSDEDGINIFPNTTGVPSTGAIGCLNTTPNQAWFFIKVDQSGSLEFDIIQSSAFDVRGNPTDELDVDFVAWGPFRNPNGECDNIYQGTTVQGGGNSLPNNVTGTTLSNFYINDEDNSNIIDCSWSAFSTERFRIPNANAGDYYLLLITNWDDEPGFIKIEQTNFGEAGAGVTDCSIVVGELGADQDVCIGTDVELDATPTTGTVDTYEWQLDTGSGFNTLTGETSATLNITDNVSGIYKAIVTDTDGNIGQDEVVITFFDVPTGTTPDNLEICDADDDGFHAFDFETDITPQVLDGQSSTDFEVLYFTSLADAEANVAGTNISGNSYTNANAFTLETIFARIQNVGVETCGDIVNFTIQVFEEPTANDPGNIVVCDDNGDGFRTFNFDTDITPVILNGQSNSDFEILYFSSLVAAQNNVAGTNIDGANYTNTTAFTIESIFARIQNNANTTCSNIIEFTIDVIDEPVANTPTDIEICDTDRDGFHTFDFDTDISPVVLGSQSDTNFEVLYFTSLPDAQANATGTNINGSSYTNATAFGLETIYARIQNNSITSCNQITSFTIQVFDNPIANDPLDVKICDSDRDGFHTFNFNADITPQVLDGQSDTDFEVLYFSNLTAAQDNIAGTNLDSDSYINTTAFGIESIFVRIQNNTNNSCSDIEEFTIQVFDDPIANTPLNIEICDTDNDGFYVYNFDTDITPQILGSQSDTDFEIIYFTTLTAAQANVAGTNVNGSSYTNAAAFNIETIFARIQNINNPTCGDIVDFTIQVFETPTANDPLDVEICDIDRDGFYTFNFDADITPQVLGTQATTNFTVSYFSSLVDAQSNVAGTNLNGTSYTNTIAFTAETIFVRIQNNANTGCSDVEEFTINVFDNPVANDPIDIEICDTDRDGFHTFNFDATITPQILDGQIGSNFNVSYFTSLTDAQNNITGTNISGSSYTNSNAFTQQTIYARLQNNANTTCSDIVDFTINVNDVANPNQPSIYRLCDDELSGSNSDLTTNSFLLNTKDNEILGLTNSNLDFSISYHTTSIGAQTSATSEVIDKTVPYAVTNSQSVFVRIENRNNPDCFVASEDAIGSIFTSFELKVDPLPTLTNPAEFIQCHNEIDLSTTIILTDTMPILSPNYMTNGELFEFYATESDANAGTSEITGSDLQTYPVTGSGEAWVRVFSDQGCYRIGKINITINFSADIPYNRTFIACDDFLDIDGNDNANNDDTDGVATFNFSESTDEIKAFFPIATRPNLTISYYESELDRASNSNEINSQIGNYRNNNDPSFANNQTIYVKIIDGNSTACFGTANIFLQVDTVPTANNLMQPLSSCDDFDSGSSDDGENININLRQTVNEILGPLQSEADFIVTYHTSQADASSGNDPILNDTNFRNTAPAGFVPGTVSRQTIFVRVEDRNKVPACFNDHLSFDIEITPLPELQNTIAAIEVCDVPTATDSDPRNRVAQNIDASIRNTDILNGRDPSIFSVRYYKSQTNALADVDRIAIANLLDYENDPANTFFPLNVNSDEPGIETLFFVIYSSDTGCASEPFTLDIRIYPEPNVPVNINNYTDCDTDNNGLGNDTDGILENIAFSSKITEVLANYTTAEQSNFTVSFHENLVDAQTGNGALDTNAYQNNTNNQTIFVRVLNNQTGCVSDDLSFEIIVNALPSYDPLDLSQVACLNNLPLTLQVDNPLTGYNYSWVENQSGNEISTAQSVDIRAGGTYTLTVTDRVTLCNRTEMFDVIESEAATITSEHVAVIDETAEIFGNNFSITINDTPGILGIGDYEYALLDEQGNFVYGYQDTFVFDQLSGGFYKVLVRDKNGCDENGIPASLVVPVVEFPDFFTPNGDGVNDTWNLKGTNSNYYPSSEIYIYNRFGKVIAKVDLSEQGWDGTYNGKRLPSDDYWVSIKLVPFDTTKKTIFKTGNLSLIRK